MLEAGVPLIRSLNVIKSQIESRKFFKVIDDVQKNVEQGGALSTALAMHPLVFSQFWVSLIEVGEASGTIPTILEKLSQYLEQQAAFRSTVISGIIYPAILFTVAMGAVAFFALVVGPKFQSIFDSMNVDLPWITSTLLAIFDFIKSNLLWLVGATVALIVAFKQYTKTYYGRLSYEKLLFRLPVVGEIYKLIIVERFSSQMSLLIDSGVPILYALDITERLVDNHHCGLIVSGIKENVKQGELLADSMEKSDFFPPMCTQMITVGEETGELSNMLKHVAVFYQDGVETFMKRFSTIIEPFMLIFMGVIIGTIVVAMFLPMFNLSQLGGGS
jgi:type II secretory pathway component PulF